MSFESLCSNFHLLRLLANVFATSYFVDSKQTFKVYPFSSWETRYFGRKQSFQRFEQCIAFFELNMGPAFEALMAKKFYDKSIQDSAKALIVEAINDVTNAIQESKDFEIDKNVLQVVERMKSINLSVMFPNEVLDLQKIEEIYDELNIDGSESLVKMFIELNKHGRKLALEKGSSWIKVVIDITKSRFRYFIGVNTLSNNHLLL